MKRTQLPLYSDTLFTYLATFLFAVCLFTYLGFPRWAVLTASAVCAFALALLVFLWLRGRLEAKYLLAKDEAQKNKLMRNVMYEVPSRDDVIKCIVTEETVREHAEPQMIIE